MHLIAGNNIVQFKIFILCQEEEIITNRVVRDVVLAIKVTRALIKHLIRENLIAISTQSLVKGLWSRTSIKTSLLTEIPAQIGTENKREIKMLQKPPIGGFCSITGYCIKYIGV
jgi:hypothetical protein